MNKQLISAIFIFIFPVLVLAQPPRRTTPAEYIELYKIDAIKDMKKMGVPASITLAQGILESDCGNSELAREAKNHFGIKCHKEWNGPTYIKDDDTKDECFRKYENVLQSFDDHGRFLRERPRYAFLFEYDITDYKSWAHGLKKAGYATNPRYAELLIKIIEEHNLSQFDRGGDNIPIASADDKIEPGAPSPLAPSAASDKSGRGTTSKSRKYTPKTNQNEVPFVIAKKGDSWFSVASQHDIRLWQIYKYNDATELDDLREGDIVYLKPKRGKPSEKIHTVSQGESLRYIAQKYGVRLNRLIKLNQLQSSQNINPGTKIKLQ